jgi:quinol monooxygenase YgiN
VSQEIHSVAVFDLTEGKEEECLKMLRDFYALLRRKGYSRDLLFRDAKQPRRLINVRFWRSEEDRAEAQEDPEIHRYWTRLPALLEMHEVYERLEPVPGFPSELE